MVRLEDVHFSYGESPALHGVDLTIHAGECVLLCGRSGCGKSTLLQIVNGIIPNHYRGSLTGRCSVDGKEPAVEGIQRLSAIVGSVFQNPKSQFFNIDTTEEVLFACCNHRVPRDEMVRRLDETAKTFGITHLLDRTIFELSGGEKQRLACAGVAINRPKVFLLDEPSSNLDGAAIRELREILARLRADGTTIVVAEHRLYYLLDLCDRVVYMESGRIAGEYTREAFIDLGRERRRAMGLRDIHETTIGRTDGAPAGEEALALHGVRCTYGRRVATHVETMRLPKCSITAVIGRNGAGKSTLAAALCGIRKARGDIVDEKPLTRKELMRRSFLVMQDVNHQLFTESVWDELMSAYDEDDGEKRTEAEEILRSLDLMDVRDRHPLSLSGGQKKRVAVATAIFMNKRYLIFDEPTSGLDYAHMRTFAALLGRIKRRVDLILVITHDHELINVSCDGIIEMADGNVVGEYTVAR